MFRDILEFIWSIIKSRYFIMITIFVLLFGSIVVRVFNLQIVNHQEYVDNYIQKTEKEITVKSTRGLIYDRNGKLLAYNELTYSVQITDTLDSSKYKNDQMNEIINKTIKIIEKYGDSLVDEFPIQLSDNNTFSYRENLSENSRLRFLKNMYGTEILDSEKERKSDTTAEEAFLYMQNKYNLSTEDFDLKTIRKIIMIRYNLSLNTYQKYIATTIAQNISENTMAAIYENASEIPGVVISEDTVRRYNESLYFAHIIGYTGRITEDEMANLNQDGEKYDSNDIIGKSGVEAYFENVLSGSKGSRRVLVDNLGKVLDVIDETSSKAGNNIYLTIDTDLQKAAYHILEQKLAGILVAKIINGKLSADQEEEYYIPVKEAYFQIFNNNVVNIENFSLDTASDNEKRIYSKFRSRYDDIMNRIRSELYDDEAKSLSSLGDAWNRYYTYIYRKLYLESYGLNVIDRDSVDTSDKVYKDWINDKISLRTFLKYCISMNWINLTKLNIDSTYSDSDEIYNALVNYITGTLSGDEEFDKIIYEYMIEDGTIRGNEICMTLYDQGVLSKDDNTYARLNSNAGYAYTFLIEKIKDLSITPSQLALKPCSGSVVLTDPESGDVLAMVSYPSYDNNLFTGSIDYNIWNKLRLDQSNPLFNRATKTRTAPGSTFKMISAIAGMEEGVITSTSTIHTKGIYENDKLTNTPKCWYYPRSHGTINVVKAIEESCNYFFYEVGFRLGSKKGTFSHDAGLALLKKYGAMFGLTEKSGVELDEYVPLFSTSDTVMSAIGQGAHSFTPVQLARYVSSLANGGYNNELTLLQKVTDVEGNTVLGNDKPQAEKAQISEKTLTTVYQGMRQVVLSTRIFKDRKSVV